MKKQVLLIIASLVVIICLSTNAWAASPALTTIKVNGGSYGKVYSASNSKGINFCQNLETGSYSKECLLSSGKKIKSSIPTNYGLIPKANSNCRFMGFYDSRGNSIEAKLKNYNILKVKTRGLTYYEYFLSKSNSIYSLLTVKMYNDLIKEFIKAKYGTTSFTVISNLDIYYPTKVYSSITAKFLKKAVQRIKCKSTINKSIYDDDFYLDGQTDDDGELSFKSSNSNVAKVKKDTGSISICGEGISTITITAAETEKFQETTKKVVLKVLPQKVSIIELKSPSSKVLRLIWAKDSYASGYKICTSTSKNFNDYIEYTVNSAQTSTVRLSKLKSGSKQYVKMRAYKISNYQKIYGPWSSVMSVKIK